MHTLHNLWASLNLTPAQLSLLLISVAVAYVIFGMAGFGTALVAAPVMAHSLPLAHIVPLLALLDCTAAALNVRRDRAAARMDEVRRLLPFMLLGSAAGAALLLLGSPAGLQRAMGVFALSYGLYLCSGWAIARRWPARAAAPFGLLGGVFSALFGSGGFVYAVYLNGRLQAPAEVRVTQSTVIGLATLARAALFAVAGLYASAQIWLLAAVLAGPMVLGTALGRRISLRMSRAQFSRLMGVVVGLSGLALLLRTA